MFEPPPGPYGVMLSSHGRGLSIYSRDGWRVAAVLPDHTGGDPVLTRATAALLAASWELRAALEAIEWGRHGIVRGVVQPICAVCDAAQDEGHVDGCLVEAALGKAAGIGIPSFR